jgi:hypothetical protein
VSPLQRRRLLAQPCVSATTRVAEILAGNCRGFAAKMMLRVIYEHLVTASFIAMKAEEAKHFDDHFSIQKWKMWTRSSRK